MRDGMNAMAAKDDGMPCGLADGAAPLNDFRANRRSGAALLRAHGVPDPVARSGGSR